MKIVSAAPLMERLSRAIGRKRELKAAAVETVEIAPGEERDSPPIIALDDEASRIRSSRHPGGIAQLTSATSRHLPTMAYRVQRAIIAQGMIYAGLYGERIAAGRRSAIIVDDVPEFREAQMCGDSGGDLFFGHWLCDSLTKEVLAARRGIVALNTTNRLRVHEDGYRDLLDMHAQVISKAYVHDLWIIDDRGYNLDHVDRFRALRSRLTVTPAPHVDLVYLARGSTGSGRQVANERDLIDQLEKVGAKTIYPESSTPSEMASQLAHCHIAISMEGSALAHAQIALRAGSTMIAIQPDDRFNLIHAAAAEAGGIGFAYCVAERGPAGYTVDVNRLMKLIDVVLGRPSR